MTPTDAINLLPAKRHVQTLRNAMPDPVPKTYHRAQVARMLERAEYIRATPKGTGIPTRYGLAIDTGSETFFVETRA